jgi:hypothetical protein
MPEGSRTRCEATLWSSQHGPICLDTLRPLNINISKHSTGTAGSSYQLAQLHFHSRGLGAAEAEVATADTCATDAASADSTA